MPTTTVTRQLVVNVTTTNTWTQMLEGNGGAAYTVPVGARADTRLISAFNLDSDSVVVSFAISTNGTIADAERILQSPQLDEGDYAEEDSVQIIQAGEGLWVRATGTTPNVTFRASILEVTP